MPHDNRNRMIIHVLFAFGTIAIVSILLLTLLNRNEDVAVEYEQIIKQEVMEQEGIDERNVIIRLIDSGFNHYEYRLIIPKGTYIVTVKDREIKYELQEG